MTRTGGQLVVDVLQQHDTEVVFTVPGESFLPVLDALHDASDRIRVTPTRHEEGAAFAAEAYAKASGRPGVCMVTRGVGVTNASIAIHTAMQDATPLLVLVGQVATAHKWREAFQEVDLPSAYGALAKWAIEVPSTDRLPELLSQALRVATTGRPGPVIVGLPEDVLFGEASDLAPAGSVTITPPGANPAQVRATIEALREARRPVLLVGREVLTENCTDRVVELAERTNAPVYTAFRRFDAFPNDHQNYAGNVALGTPVDALPGLYEADLVLYLGDRFDEITTHSYRLGFENARVVHVASDASLLGTWGRNVTGVVSSVTTFVDACLDALEDEASPALAEDGWLERCRNAYEHATSYEAAFSPEQEAVNLSDAMRALRDLAPDDTALVTDAGNFSAWVARYFRFLRPRTHFGPISGAMGYAVPGAIGVALANRERPVVALAGDGGFAMTMSELAVAQAQRLHIVFLVFVNGTYGTIRMHQEKHYPGRTIATDLDNPSFVGIAQAFGMEAQAVSSNPELETALECAFSSPRPMLIEIFEGAEKLAAWAPPASPERSSQGR